MGGNVGPNRPIPNATELAETVKLQQEGLTRLEGHAEKWVALVSSIAGVATLFGLGFKVDAILELETSYRNAAVVLGLAAIVTTVVGVYLASLAATGGAFKDTPVNLTDLSTRITAKSKDASTNIGQARLATLVGVVTAFAAMGITVFGPAVEKEPMWVLSATSATPEASRVYCGELVTLSDSGAFALVPHPTETALPTVVAASFDQLTAVESCDEPVAPSAKEG